MCGHVPCLVSLVSKPQRVYQTQADPQAFEHLLMTEPLFTVRDLGVELADTDDTELLRNYAFNISQGIVQRVSRFFDALALMDERGEAPPARGEGGTSADSARGGVMGFGHKRNVCNQEKMPARRVASEQQEKERSQKEAEEAAAAAALKAAEQDTKLAALEAQVAAAAALKAAEQDKKVAALEAKVAEMQALAATSAALRPISVEHYSRVPYSTRCSRALCSFSAHLPPVPSAGE